MGLRCNALGISQQRFRLGVLRGSASPAVLALVAAALLSGPSFASVDAGQSINISTAGSGQTLNGGTVKVDTAKDDGTTSYGTDFALNSSTVSVIDANGKKAILSGKFTGSGGITFSDSVGGGIITLSNGSSTYTGVTTIGTGTTLALTDDATLADSSTFAINGTFDISDANSSATITSMSGSGNVVLGSLSLTLSDAASETFSGVISGKGGFAMTEGTETLTGINTYTGSTTVSSGTLYLKGAGSISQSANVVVYGTLDASGANSVIFKSLAGSGTLALGSNNLVLTAASGAFSGTITGTGQLELQSGTQYLAGTNSFTNVVITGGTLEAASTAVTYNVANSGTFSFYNSDALAMTGVISGSGAVTKYGSGIATISTAQTYTGATTISGGTILLTGAGSLSASSGIEVDSILDLTSSNNAAIKALTGNGTVRLGTQSLAITAGSGDFSGTITGSGTLSITGGSQSFSGTNTYTGTTTVGASGTLVLVAGASLKSAVVNNGAIDISAGLISTGTATIASLSGSGTVGVGANTLVLSNAVATDTFSGTISDLVYDKTAKANVSGGGGLWVSAGTAHFAGTGTYTGMTTVSTGATLYLDASGSLAAASKLNISGTFDATAVSGGLTFASLAGSGKIFVGSNALSLNTVSGASTVFSGVLSGTHSGSAGLTVSGAGTQVLSGENTYTGGTVINDGATLQIGNGASTGSILGDVAVNGSGTLKFYRMDSGLVYSGTISGDGNLLQAGIGTTTLTGNNTYKGTTTISAGTLQIGNGGTTGWIESTAIVDDGTLAFNRLGSVQVDALISGYGNLSVVGGTVVLTSANTFTGITRIASGGTLSLLGAASVAASDRVIANGTFDISGTTAGTSISTLSGSGALALGDRTLTLAAANDIFSGVISGNVGSALVITSGTETLLGTSSAFAGATTVNGGALVVTGSIAGSAVTVNSGATLSGNGSIGSLTVANGGTVKAGVGGSGTLTANGNVNLQSGSTYAVDVTSAGAAKLAVTGSATLNGALQITSSDGTYDLGNKLTIVTASGGITYGSSFSATSTFTGTNGAIFKTTLDKTTSANTLYLTINLNQLTPALTAAGGASKNQLHVAAGIDKAIAAGTTLPAGFQALGNDTSGVLLSDTTALAGEIGADASLAAKSLFNPFLDAMSDRTAMLRPLAKGQSRPLETWISAYGGSDIVNGDPSGTGSHKFRSTVDGVVLGVQWAPWSNMLLGGAISAGSSTFHIAGDLGKGNAKTIQAGVYGQLQASRHFYNSFEAAVSATQIKTSRQINVDNADVLTGKVTAYSFGGRYEAGIQTPWFNPYVAAQDHITMLPSYTEGAASGHNTFALKYDSRNVNSGRIEVGLRHYIDVDVTPRWILTPDFTLHINDRLAWAYDLSDGSQSNVVFANLPSSDFSVFGAKQNRQGVLGSVGADVLFNNGLRITTHVDTAFTTKSQSFTGFAGVGYTW